MADGASAPSVAADDVRAELERLRLQYSIGLEFNSSLDFDELLPKVFDTVLSAVGAQGGSIWIAEGDALRCRLALGSASQKLVGTTLPVGTGFVGDVARKQRTTIVTDAMSDARFQERIDRSSTMVTLGVMATPMVVKGVTVGAIQVMNKVTGLGVFEDGDRELLEGLAASAAVALRNAQLVAAERRAKDLAVLLDISREITATLDLDRVLLSVVNLASRAFPFDQGAVGLLEKRGLEIRAIGGHETVDRKAEPVRRLAARGAWAADRDESFYLAYRAHPATESERAFVAAFGHDLETEEIESGLYLPLRDEEGRLGVVVFESKRPGFVDALQRELAQILANQTSVAVRNAQLYAQVPLVDALGALAAKRRAWMQLPRRRQQGYGAARNAPAAGPAGAEGAGAAAASHDDPAEERLQRTRAQGLRREAALLDAQLAATTVRAPVSGVVLTARPEERLGARLEGGDLVVTLGRTDTLELEFGVPQREIERVAVGQRVHLRVDALPQHTFEGLVTSLGQLPRDTTEEVRFPVRALVPNPGELLKPGMAAHVRVLTARTSLAGRLLRGPVRWLRLTWWRVWA